MGFAIEFRNVRMGKLLSQKRLAAILKVTEGTINRWENGKALPNISAMNNIQTFCAEESVPYEALTRAWQMEREMKRNAQVFDLSIGVDDESELICGISDDELTRRFREAVRIDAEERRIMGLPIARYDAESGKAYLEYPDGRREYVGE